MKMYLLRFCENKLAVNFMTVLRSLSLNTQTAVSDCNSGPSVLDGGYSLYVFVANLVGKEVH